MKHFVLALFTAWHFFGLALLWTHTSALWFFVGIILPPFSMFYVMLRLVALLGA